MRKVGKNCEQICFKGIFKSSVSPSKREHSFTGRSHLSTHSRQQKSLALPGATLAILSVLCCNSDQFPPLHSLQYRTWIESYLCLQSHFCGSPTSSTLLKKKSQLLQSVAVYLWSSQLPHILIPNSSVKARKDQGLFIKPSRHHHPSDEHQLCPAAAAEL